MTTTDSWLPLAEYSMKHHVSISTLRRRIKADDIKYRFDDGKYLVWDETQNRATTTEEHRPSLISDAQKVNVAAATQNTIQGEPGESVISAANKLLSDLKKAYTQILQEKEEQILQLKEETMDLKTLIKVLEAENTRLRERDYK